MWPRLPLLQESVEAQCQEGHLAAVTEIERIHFAADAQILQLRATSPLAEPGQYVYAVDVFTIADDRIRTLEIYYR